MVIHPSIQPIVCVIGNPVAGNPLQFVFEGLLAEMKLDWRIISLNVQRDAIAQAIAGASAMGIAGIAVASPFQTEVPGFLDSISESSKLANWVDCVSRHETGFHGENQLGRSMANLCLSKCDRMEQVWLLGSDARAKAIAAEFMLRNIETWLVDPSSPQVGERFAISPDLKLDPQKPAAIIDVESSVTDTVPIFRLLAESSSQPRVLASTALETTWDSTAAELSITGLDILTQSIADYFCVWTGQPANQSGIREACEEYFEL